MRSGGWGPGFVATGLSGVATAYLLMPTTGTAAGVRDAILRVVVTDRTALLVKLGSLGRRRGCLLSG